MTYWHGVRWRYGNTDRSRFAHLVVAAGVELARRHDVRQGAEAVEQHGEELDDQDECEEEHENETDRLHLKVLLVDENLSINEERSVDGVSI